MPQSSEINPSLEGESGKLPEKLTRQQAVETFISASNRFSKQNIPDHAEPTDSQETKNAVWLKKTLADTKDRIERGEYYTENRFGPNGEYTTRQGIVVEQQLLKFLQEQSKDKTLSIEERAEVKRELYILTKFSKKSTRFHRKDYTDLQRRNGRVIQEAQLIHDDDRSTGEESADYFLALDTLMGRRELDANSLPETLEETATDNEVADPEDPSQQEQPQPSTIAEVRYNMTMINQTINPRKKAEEEARDAVREEQRRGGWWPKDIFRKIKFRVGKDYYEKQFVKRAMEAKLVAGNSNATMDLVKNASLAATHQIEEERAEGRSAIAMVRNIDENAQYQNLSERSDVKLIKAEGELKNRLTQQILLPLVAELNPGAISTPEARLAKEKALQTKLTNFINTQLDAGSGLDDTGKNALREVFGAQTNQTGRNAEYFATDLIELAQDIRDKKDHHAYAMERLDQDLTITLANISWAAETQMKQKWIDKLVAFTEQNKTGRGWVANPATIGAGFAIATFNLTKGTNRVANALGAGVFSGGLFAGLRRWSELKDDISAQRVDKTYGRETPDKAKRREALDKYSYNTISVGELLNGRAADGVNRDNKLLKGTDLEGDTRLGINQLMDQVQRDPTSETNRDALLRRLAEISARISYSKEQKEDFITFDDRNKVMAGRMELSLASAKARELLQNSGMTPDDVRREEQKLIGEWKARLKDDKSKQDYSFNVYKLRNSLGSAAFAIYAGWGAGLLGQEAVALAQRYGENIPNGNLGNNIQRLYTTIKENFEKNRNPLDNLGTGLQLSEKPTGRTYIEGVVTNVNNIAIGAAPLRGLVTGEGMVNPYEGGVQISKMQNQLRELGFAKNQSIPLENGFQLTKETVDGTNQVALFDMNGQTPVRVDSPNMFLIKGSDGIPHLVVSGQVTNPELQKFLSGSASIDNKMPAYDLKALVDTTIAQDKANTFHFGNSIIDINGHDGTVSMYWGDPSQADSPRVFGKLDKVTGKFIFDRDDPSNSNLDYAQFQKVAKDLGWNIQEHNELIPSAAATAGVVTENATQQLQEADIFKLPGVLETDQFLKTWNFHVLRPDIVDATGNHTHNELTLQLGKLIRNNRDFVWDQPGEAGKISFLGQLTKEPITSHLLGIDPAKDPGLARLIDNAGGLNKADMVYMLELSNDKQIALPVDGSGVAHLPKGMFDDQGRPLGIKTISATIIQKPDGSILKGSELFAKGEIPHGSVVHSLAGEKFNELPLGTIPTPAPEPLSNPEPITHRLFDIAPPDATEFIPPVPTELEPPPIIPIPFAPRHPLEQMQTAQRIYYGYNDVLSPENTALFERNRSQTLKENSKAVLDPYQETEAYFNHQSPEYMATVRSLASQINTPPSADLRAVVCIPVAGHEESAQIYETLQNYSHQTAANNQYEIVLFVNHPKGTSASKTTQEINRFIKAHPDLPVRVITKQLDPSEAKMSVIRKYLSDTVLLRQHQMGPNAHDLILISNDADLKGVAPEYISNFIAKFEKNNQLDGMAGQLDWDPASYVEYPAIHAGTRLFQYLDLLSRKGNHGQRPSSGANFAYKGSIYAGIGGYQINDQPGAEDILLGQAIRAARNSNDTIGYAGSRVSRIYTSSRRAISTFLNKRSPIEQWDRNWGIMNDDVRKLKIGKHVTQNYDLPAVQNKLKQELELVIDRTLGYYDESGNKESDLFKRAVDLLGIEYKLNDRGTIEITDMTSFIEGIKNYQNQGLRLMDIKSGRSPEQRNAPTPNRLQRIGSTIGNTVTGLPSQVSGIARSGTETLGNVAGAVIARPRRMGRSIGNITNRTGGALKRTAQTLGNLPSINEAGIGGPIRSAVTSTAGALGSTAGTIGRVVGGTPPARFAGQVGDRLTQVPAQIRSAVESTLERRVQNGNFSGSIPNTPTTPVNPILETPADVQNQIAELRRRRNNASVSVTLTPAERQAEANRLQRQIDDLEVSLGTPPPPAAPVSPALATPPVPTVTPTASVSSTPPPITIAPPAPIRPPVTAPVTPLIPATPVTPPSTPLSTPTATPSATPPPTPVATGGTPTGPVSTTIPTSPEPTRPVVPTTEIVPKAGENLVEQLGEVLNTATENQQIVVAGVNKLMEYVQTLELPFNGKIVNPTFQFTPSGELRVSSSHVLADVKKGPFSYKVDTNFTVLLGNDPMNGGIGVINYELGSLGKVADAIARKRVEGYIANLNRVIIDQVNAQTPGWVVDTFALTKDQKLSFTFKRKT